MSKFKIVTLQVLVANLIFLLQLKAQNPGSLDASFNYGLGQDYSFQFNNEIASQPIAIAFQSNKIIIGGSFAEYHGKPAPRIARIDENGVLDTTFQIGSGAGGTNNFVESLAVDELGRVYVGGRFTSFNQVSVNRIVRLLSNGQVDNSFQTGTGVECQTGSFVCTVTDIKILPDNKILLVGWFDSYDGTQVGGGVGTIIRLLEDGSLDPTFNNLNNFGGGISDVEIMTDGSILVAGDFSVVNGQTRRKLLRLQSNGQVDESFPNHSYSGGVSIESVKTILKRSDGKLLIGGDFQTINGISCKRFALLEANGQLNSSFNASIGPDYYISSLVALGNGNILVGGGFSSWNNEIRSGIAFISQDGSLLPNYPSLNSNGPGEVDYVIAFSTPNAGALLTGSLTSFSKLDNNGQIDSTFNPQVGANNFINFVYPLSSQKYLLGGYFSTYNGKKANKLCRIELSGELDQTFISPDFIGQDLMEINTALEMPNGKIWVGGKRDLGDTPPGLGLFRLNSNGTIDNTFAPDSGLYGTNNQVIITKIIPVANNNVLVIGDFPYYIGSGFRRILLLDSNGIRVPSFQPSSGANDLILDAISTQSKLYLGGRFTTFNGIASSRFAALDLMTGNLLPDFQIGTGFNSNVISLALDDLGRILVGGNFINYKGQTANRIIQLNIDGSVNSNFASGSGFNVGVKKLVYTASGQILAAGLFTSYNNVPINGSGLVKLSPEGVLDNNFIAKSNSTNFYPEPSGTILIAGTILNYDNYSVGNILRIHNEDIPETISENSFVSEDISLFPNPGQFYFSISTKVDIQEIEVSDLLGRKIETRRLDGNKVELINSKSGLYIVVLKSSSKCYTKKWLVH